MTLILFSSNQVVLPLDRCNNDNNSNQRLTTRLARGVFLRPSVRDKSTQDSTFRIPIFFFFFSQLSSDHPLWHQKWLHAKFRCPINLTRYTRLTGASVYCDITVISGNFRKTDSCSPGFTRKKKSLMSCFSRWRRTMSLAKIREIANKNFTHNQEFQIKKNG